jgi:hypothetical protein
VQLTANPASLYGFTNWSGNASGTTNPTLITLTSHRAVTANFTSQCYTLTVVVDPPGAGSVNASPAPNCNGGTKYTSGTVVQLTANNNSGWVFDKWTTDLTGTVNPGTVAMTANKEVWAVYAPTGP